MSEVFLYQMITSKEKAMRTINYPQRNKSILVIVTTLIFCLIAITTLADDGPRRKRRFKNRKARVYQKALKANFSTSFMNTASGHKSGYSANVGFGNSRNLFEAGAILNSETSQLSGAHLRYKRFFMPNHRTSSLYIQASAIYRNNSPLKSKLNEVMHDQDYVGDFETFNTTELYAGLGFQQRFFRSLFADVSVGLGGYKRSVASDFDHRHNSFIRYSDDQGLGLNVKFSIGYYLW